ncbi:thyrotroph embryonic factor [Plakobranchus ocellatus]|uniref:Thyrotroph embryonic factor n=1 Tax=Plakobranchus ocellatus TaxID=259542 RepID=A0AAV4CU42_9GAST|nr:thyrotroph embryonic factor [Plakobranchus ocellatus]
MHVVSDLPGPDHVTGDACPLCGAWLPMTCAATVDQLITGLRKFHTSSSSVCDLSARVHGQACDRQTAGIRWAYGTAHGMQHKASDTWKCAYNTEYPAMAEDAVADTTVSTMTSASSPSNNSNSSTINATTKTSANSSPVLINGKASPDMVRYSTTGPVSLTKDLGEEADLSRGVITSGARELSNLEQKIQELRAEKEARELGLSPREIEKMAGYECIGHDEVSEGRDTHENQDTPLDFSVKRRASSFSGSVTDESRASSSSPSHGTADYRGGSLLAASPSPEPVSMADTGTRSGDDIKDFHKAQNSDMIHQQFHHHLHPSFAHRRSEGTPSPESHRLNHIKIEQQDASLRAPEMSIKSELNIKPEMDIKPEVDRHTSSKADHYTEQQTQLPGLNPNGASPLPQPLMNTLGGLFPGLNPNFLAGKSAIGAFSQMAAAAAFMDPRLNMNNNNNNSNGSSNGSGRKTTRPFKAYPKEALQMPLGGFFGAPGLSPSLLQQGIEAGVFAGMNTDDLMTLYNQQLQLLRDKQVSSSTPNLPQGQKGNISPSLSPNMTNGNGSHLNESHFNHNPHQQEHSKYRNHRQPSERSPPHHLASSHPYIPMNPSSNNILTSQQNNCSSPPVEHTSGNSNFSPAANNTLVSSTSPSPSASNHTSGSGNSRKRPRSLPDEQKDAAYWERRRKNNDAAKRSRDARRAKEDEIALRAALLEQENIKLRVEVASLKTETSRLRCLLYNS